MPETPTVHVSGSGLIAELKFVIPISLFTIPSRAQKDCSGFCWFCGQPTASQPSSCASTTLLEMRMAITIAASVKPGLSTVLRSEFIMAEEMMPVV